MKVVADQSDPQAANALQEGLGGQFGEMRTMMQYLFQGTSPANDGETVETPDEAPEGFSIRILPERPEEFSPGLSPKLKALAEAVAEFEAKGCRTGGLPGPGERSRRSDTADTRKS